MSRSLSMLLGLAVICQPLFAGSPAVRLGAVAILPKGKTDKKIVFQPHAQPNQDIVDATGKHSDKDFVIREWDGSLYVEASLIYWDGDDRVASLVLAIQNTASEGHRRPPTLNPESQIRFDCSPWSSPRIEVV